MSITDMTDLPRDKGLQGTDLPQGKDLLGWVALLGEGLLGEGLLELGSRHDRPQGQCRDPGRIQLVDTLLMDAWIIRFGPKTGCNSNTYLNSGKLWTPTELVPEQRRTATYCSPVPPRPVWHFPS